MLRTMIRRVLGVRDAVFALALCAAGEYELAAGITYSGRPVWPGPHAVNAALIPLLTLPLAWRRRRPLATCLLVLGLMAVASAVLGGGEATTEFLLFIAVVFSGAAYAGRPWLVAGAALVAGTAHELRDPSVRGFADAVWALGMLVIAFQLGQAVHARQERIGALTLEAAGREARHAEQVAAATAAERAAIARELHDIVAHAVSVVVIQSQAGARALPDRPDVAALTLATIEDSARSALTDLRRLLTVLGGDQDVGVPAPAGSLAQLDQLVQTVRASGLRVSLALPGSLPRLDPAAELAAYRVVQEALTNATRYARGSTVTVTLIADDGVLDIRVVNTAGSPSQVAEDLGTGRGLIGMRQRLELVGGRLVTAARVDDGFEVRAAIPLAANELPRRSESVP